MSAWISKTINCKANLCHATQGLQEVGEAEQVVVVAVDTADIHARGFYGAHMCAYIGHVAVC